MSSKIIKQETYILSEFVYGKRKLMRMSLRQLSDKSGVSTASIGKIENCETNPTWSNARKILKALNTTLAEYAAWERGILNE